MAIENLIKKRLEASILERLSDVQGDIAKVIANYTTEPESSRSERLRRVQEQLGIIKQDIAILSSGPATDKGS